MRPEQTGCAFCAQIAGRREHNALASLLGSGWSQRPLLVETETSVVMPSIGALAPGHALVSPKRHVRSAAMCEGHEQAELTALIEYTAALIGRLSLHPVHIFEHGSSVTHDGRVACSVEHAHVHVIPAPVDILDSLPAVASWARMRKDRGELLTLTSGDEYLFYESPTGERLVATTRVGFPSQVLRQVFAKALDLDFEWNWRREPAVDRVRATVELFCASDVPAALSAC